ncbi:MAG: hypothetical protein ACXWFW_16225 [Usitatibacter sp.]
MSITNYTGVHLVISERDERGAYDFIFANNGDLVLWNVRIGTYDLLGPGAFGLDDTHMVESMKSEPVVDIGHLDRGESIIVRRKKWGTLEQYRGPASGTFYATYSPEAGSEVRYGFRGTFSVRRNDGTPFVARPAGLEGFTSSYRAGYAAASWLRRVLGKR